MQKAIQNPTVIDAAAIHGLAGPAYARYLNNSLLRFWEAEETFSVGRVYLFPVDVPWSVVVDRIGHKCWSGVATANIRLGIYRDSATGDDPTGAQLVVQTASVAQLGLRNLQFTTIADTLLTPGQYFLALQADSVVGGYASGYVTCAGGAYYYDRGGGYGVFTNPCPVLTAWNPAPYMYLRVKTNLGL